MQAWCPYRTPNSECRGFAANSGFGVFLDSSGYPTRCCFKGPEPNSRNGDPGVRLGSRKRKGNIGHATHISRSGRVNVPGRIGRLRLQQLLQSGQRLSGQGRGRLPTAAMRAAGRPGWRGKLSLLHDPRSAGLPGDASAEPRPVISPDDVSAVHRTDPTDRADPTAPANRVPSGTMPGTMYPWSWSAWSVARAQKNGCLHRGDMLRELPRFQSRTWLSCNQSALE